MKQKKYRFPVVFHLDTGSGCINTPHGGRYFISYEANIKNARYNI